MLNGASLRVDEWSPQIEKYPSLLLADILEGVL
jgi:hypothetical protein